MTGEITLTGRVIPIGGLREKSTAAYTAGIRHILIPKDNVKDLEEIDPVVREEVTFTPVSRVDEVLDIALVKPSTLPLPNSETQNKDELAPVVIPGTSEPTYTAL